VTVRRRRSGGDLLAGFGALVVLAVLVAGIPLALLRFFGSPIPQHMPTSDDFTKQIEPSTVLHILVGLVWLAWLQLLLCVMVEVYAGIRGIGVPARVPLAGGTQSLVHRLVVAALLLFSATTAVMPAFAGRDLRPAMPAVSQAQFSEPVHATATLPSTATPVADVLPAEHQAEAPQSATVKIYRVQPPQGRHHESLWEIAEKCLGAGRRYQEIFDLNKGHVQPDGSHLHQSSLIKPGWVLEMPADAHGTQVIPRSELHDYFRYGHAVARPQPPQHQPPQSPPQSQPPQQSRPPQHQPPQQQPAQPPTQQPSQQPTQQPSQQPSQQPTQQPTQQPSQTPQTPPQQLPGTRPASDSHSFIGELTGYEVDWQQELAGASLLAAGLLVALARRRRMQMWHRTPGRRIARPEGDAAAAERALRIGADPEGVRLLDLGLRYLSRSLAAEGRTLPTVYGVHLGRDSLDLWIAPADRNPPPLWEAHDDGQVWRFYRDSLRKTDSAGLSDVLAPYPGLISIGTNDNGRILVDLEAAHGLIAVRGPEELRRAILAAAAVELATNSWSDHMRITLVGFGEELALIAPDRIRTVETLADALPEMEARAAEVKQAMAASGVDSVLTGRCRGVFGEAWMPHYLIMADQPSSDEANRLVALARTGPRMAAGYLVAGEVPGATWTWEAGYGEDDEDRLTAGVLGFDVAAQVVPERHYRAVADLFRTSGRLDEGIVLAEPDDGEPFAATARTVTSARTATSAGSAGTAGSVGAEERPVVDIRLLGPVEIDAPGPMEEGRRVVCTEALVFLATHPNGVHPTVLGGAVWPRGVAAGVRDATIARISDWLGRDSKGRPNLYYDERGRIRLGSQVRVDWSVFRWLLWRSAAEPSSETAYLSYALDLVRGPLLADRPRGRYGWLANEELEYEAAARVVDVAHRLVLLRLDGGDAKGAAAAARAGLRMVPEEERLWRDLMRAVHTQGDQAELHTVVDELRFHVQRGPMMDQMQPETEALIEELVPFYRPGRTVTPHLARGA
jgi:hypothetical protein